MAPERGLGHGSVIEIARLRMNRAQGASMILRPHGHRLADEPRLRDASLRRKSIPPHPIFRVPAMPHDLFRFAE
jgi:hypothetical protein